MNRRGRLALVLWLLAGFLLTPAAAGQTPGQEQSSLAQRNALMPVSVELQDGSGKGRDLTAAIEIVLLLTFLTVLPALLLTLTCFTRIIIVLSFVRRAMATPEMPPNPVVIGLALFLTAAIMQPVAGGVYDKAVKPYLEDEIGVTEAAELAGDEVKRFLLKYTREEDAAMFLEISGEAPVDRVEDLPFRVTVPAFVMSELKTAFTMGFIIYLPFLVVDLVIASILLSMGMFMLPPMIIATPIKVLLFILMDGWSLVISQLWISLVA